MPKCIFQRHISPERYLITPFDQFLSSFPCCQFVTAFTLLFQLWSTGTVSTILHDSMDESVDCIFIVHIYKSTFKYIKLYILLFSTLNLNCFNGTLLKCECGNEWEKKCTKAVVSIFNIHRDKMPFESWYSRGMACEHLNIFIFPGWSEFIWSQLYMNTEAQRRRNTC